MWQPHLNRGRVVSGVLLLDRVKLEVTTEHSEKAVS